MNSGNMMLGKAPPQLQTQAGKLPILSSMADKALQMAQELEHQAGRIDDFQCRLFGGGSNPCEKPPVACEDAAAVPQMGYSLQRLDTAVSQIVQRVDALMGAGLA